MKKNILFFGIMMFVFFGCISETVDVDQNSSTNSTLTKQGWMDVELTDVATNQTFKISDFKGKPILVESFAVWCSTCLAQQRESKKLKEELGESVVHISLDTDPNEDRSIVLGHINQYGFDWFYAITPISMTQDLINEYGISVVNAPGAPVILICEDQTTRFLRRGVKSADDLKEEIAKGC
jgi:thiol-disulfide isomerase/thioredoxin